MKNAEALIDAFSNLNEAEQRKFEERFMDLLRFRKTLTRMADGVAKGTLAIVQRCGDTLRLDGKDYANNKNGITLLAQDLGEKGYKKYIISDVKNLTAVSGA